MKKIIMAISLALTIPSVLLAQDTLWTKTLDFGPMRDASVALYDIDNDGKDEIFIGTSKGLDANFNEIRPAGFICLEDDGTVKWTRTFPSITTPDPRTGKTYNTTSVTTAPFFSDIDGDGQIEILIGVGAETFGEVPNVVGQPGDKGGIYALESDGSIKWFHESLDIAELGDQRPDGVYGSPIVYDIDNDGKREIIYNGWDQFTWILDASTGAEQSKLHLLDTIWSTPAIADINNDGIDEILVTADITENPDAATQTGGIFHVISPNGIQNIPGFDSPVASPLYNSLRGKFEDQPLWSSPVVGDIDNDGFLEIAYGTGNFFKDGRGEYIRVWNHDGTEKFKLTTQGRTFATPLIADIDNDGNLDIVAVTLGGWVHAWDNKGNVIFSTQVDANPIFNAPLAVDTNNDGKLEIIFSSGVQVVILDTHGNMLHPQYAMINQLYRGSVAIQDIDNNGVLDLISGGTTPAKNQAVVYRWAINGSSSNARIGRYQYIGSNTNVEQFVKRFYKEILGRNADPSGLNYWTDRLVTGTFAAADIAKGFIESKEFIEKSPNDLTYVTILYKAFFNRSPDIAGLNTWLAQINQGITRNTVLDGFLGSPEFSNLSRAYRIKPIKTINKNSNITAFVTRFYQVILGRLPDNAGLNSWVEQLASGVSSASDIATGFIASSEFTQQNTTPNEYVTILYNAFFNRSPDQGITAWVNLIKNGGDTTSARLSVLGGFLNSQEFSNLTHAYNIRATKQ
jgi:hypothetical protein